MSRIYFKILFDFLFSYIQEMCLFRTIFMFSAHIFFKYLMTLNYSVFWVITQREVV